MAGAEAAVALDRASRTDLPEPGARIHLVGIGGAGMRGLAVLLAARGYEVSGCDREPPGEGTELAGAGIGVVRGHDPTHAAGSALVIHSAALPADHPELEAARAAGIPTIKRAAALGALVDGRRVAGVAGTHGKTTVTAMLGLALEAAGSDPLVAVGGRVAAWDGNVRAGDGPAVVEADEFDRSFLELDPTLALVTNLEIEHLESYGSFAALRAAFLEFARRAGGREGALLCADDPGARELAAELDHSRTYGFADEADYRIEPTAAGGTTGMAGGMQGSRWRLRAPEGQLEFAVAVPGRHNVQNAAAAMAAALRLGAEPTRLADALADFRGVGRRLELIGRRGDIPLVDDYAHHPTEVRASLAALRRVWPDARLVAVFQPHLYSRTNALYREFARALEDADAALVLPIYAAREDPISGVTSARIVDAAADRVRAADAEEVLAELETAAARSSEGTGGPPAREVWVFMGAGDVTALAHRALGGAA